MCIQDYYGNYNQFSSVNSNCILWVPKGSAQAYKEAIVWAFFSGGLWKEYQNIRELPFGDVNIDGKVNVADIVEVVNAKAGTPSASYSMTNADVDGNDSITEEEIVKIILQK